jgi:hypothetical protein
MTLSFKHEEQQVWQSNLRIYDFFSSVTSGMNTRIPVSCRTLGAFEFLVHIKYSFSFYAFSCSGNNPCTDGKVCTLLRWSVVVNRQEIKLRGCTWHYYDERLCTTDYYRSDNLNISNNYNGVPIRCGPPLTAHCSCPKPAPQLPQLP